MICQLAKFDGDWHCGSGDIKLLVCHVIPQDNVIIRSFGEPLMVNHHPVNSGGQRHCGSGGMMFLGFEEQNSTCSLKGTVLEIL